MTLHNFKELDSIIDFLNDKYKYLEELESLLGIGELNYIKIKTMEQIRTTQEEYSLIPKFIDTIENELIQEIVLFRLVDNYTFEQIGDLIGYTRSSVYKVYKKADLDNKYNIFKCATPIAPH